MTEQSLAERVHATENQAKEALAVNDWTKYDGERVTGSNSSPVYLVLHGQLRWIPNPATYTNLFASWDGIIVSDYLVDNVPRGPALTNGAVLAKGSGSPVYLVTNGQKLWIPNPETFNKFAFNWDKIVTVPDVVIDFIPTGPNIG
ncbi:hypothetical protein PI87_00960 [Ralstonia sp. A12]|uniref:hypothetical protein n=1 Tax=Ralstonia sp. A12 TaxID=1217052 RepID=UPI000574DAF7|nr:hypothetical protein [Ralstonia sp. A12]KHK58361.1 hypothetical protein PI87_00960 [Ralstonia sp. A12]